MLTSYQAVRFVLASAVSFSGALLSASGTEERPELLGRLYFGGASAVLENSELGYLEEIAALPETTRLKEQFANGLARHLLSDLPDDKKSAALTAAQSLVSGLYETPFYLQFWKSPDDRTAWTLAVRLPENKFSEWSEKLEEVSGSFGEGSQAPFRYRSSSDWFLISKAGSAFDGAEIVLDSLKTSTSPFDSEDAQVASGSLDLGWALEAFPGLSGLIDEDHKSGEISFAVTPTSRSLRTEATIKFDGLLDLKLPEWRIPKESIHDPLSSFLAVRATETLLGDIGLLHRLGTIEVPDQVYVWSRSGLITETVTPNLPFLTYFAVPMKNAASVLKTAVENYQELYPASSPTGRALPITWHEGLSRAITDKLPIIRPYIDSTETGSGEYLVAGLFPVAQKVEETEPAPKELYEQFQNDEDIVIYHWEITAHRLKQLHPIVQLGDMLQTSLQPSRGPDAIRSIYTGHEWLNAAGPFMGNSVTQLELAAPDTLTLTRQSPAGLTAFEMIALFKMLISKGFLPVSP